jgi:hypothetical protein
MATNADVVAGRRPDPDQATWLLGGGVIAVVDERRR